MGVGCGMGDEESRRSSHVNFYGSLRLKNGVCFTGTGMEFIKCRCTFMLYYLNFFISGIISTEAIISCSNGRISAVD